MSNTLWEAYQHLRKCKSSVVQDFDSELATGYAEFSKAFTDRHGVPVPPLAEILTDYECVTYRAACQLFYAVLAGFRAEYIHLSLKAGVLASQHSPFGGGISRLEACGLLEVSDTGSGYSTPRGKALCFVIHRTLLIHAYTQAKSLLEKQSGCNIQQALLDTDVFAWYSALMSGNMLILRKTPEGGRMVKPLFPEVSQSFKDNPSFHAAYPWALADSEEVIARNLQLEFRVSCWGKPLLTKEKLPNFIPVALLTTLNCMTFTE